MRSAFWRSLALALAMVALPSIALAGGEVARSSMAGTNFMNTSADTWIFFHRSMSGEGFAEFVSEGYNASGGDIDQGYGRVILPVSDFRLGVEINDPATASNIVDYSWNGAPYQRVFAIGDWIAGTSSANAFFGGQMATVKLAGGLGSGAGWSVGAGYYNESFKDNAPDPAQEDSSVGFNINGSFGGANAPKTEGAFEVAAEFTSHSAKSEDNADPSADPNTDFSGIHFGANGRWSMSDDSHFEGAFAFLSSDSDVDDTDDADDNPVTTSEGILALKVTYARDLFEEVDRGGLFEVAMDYISQSAEPDGADKVSQSAFALPVARFSAWHEFIDNWTLYGGVSGGYVFAFTDEFGGDEEGATETSFDWSLGLGWDPMDMLGLEAFITTSNLDQIASLGNSDPLFGGFGAHATW